MNGDGNASSSSSCWWSNSSAGLVALSTSFRIQEWRKQSFRFHSDLLRIFWISFLSAKTSCWRLSGFKEQRLVDTLCNGNEINHHNVTNCAVMMMRRRDGMSDWWIKTVEMRFTTSTSHFYRYRLCCTVAVGKKVNTCLTLQASIDPT